MFWKHGDDDWQMDSEDFAELRDIVLVVDRYARRLSNETATGSTYDIIFAYMFERALEDSALHRRRQADLERML